MSKDKIVTQNDVRRQIRRIDARFEILRTFLAVGIALAIVLVIVTFVSDTPFFAIQQLLTGPLTSVRRFSNVIELMIPLTFTGIAITITFKTHRFNLISDSAFYLGAMIAVILGVNFNAPPLVTIGIIFLVAFIVGGLLGFTPAILRNKFGANELVTSLMLNYVVGYFVNYLFNNVVRDTYSPSLQSLPLPEGVNLGTLMRGTRLHWGLFIALFISVLAYIIIYKTKWGYALRATGLNERFAKYSGMNVTLIIIGAQVIGAAVAGLGGAVEMLGVYNTFRWSVSPGYGFDGVIIATLARNNPLYVPISAFFLAYIRVGADILNRVTDIPAEIISVVQATIILLIAAQAFLSTWKQREIVKVSEKTELKGVS